MKEGIGNLVSGILEGLQKQTQSIDSRNRVASCKRDDRKLLDKNFESKSIKEGGKTSVQ